MRGPVKVWLREKPSPAKPCFGLGAGAGEGLRFDLRDKAAQKQNRTDDKQGERSCSAGSSLTPQHSGTPFPSPA